MRRRLNDKPDSGGGGGGGYIPAVIAMKTGVIGGGIGAAHLIKKKDERDAEQKDRNQRDQRDADAEMKRESRGVKMPANFGILEESKQDAKDSATAKKQDKAYNESLTTENKAKGGMVSASSRADGCATKGKTRGKMV